MTWVVHPHGQYQMRFSFCLWPKTIEIVMVHGPLRLPLLILFYNLRPSTAKLERIGRTISTVYHTSFSREHDRLCSSLLYPVKGLVLRLTILVLFNVARMRPILSSGRPPSSIASHNIMDNQAILLKRKALFPSARFPLRLLMGTKVLTARFPTFRSFRLPPSSPIYTSGYQKASLVLWTVDQNQPSGQAKRNT